jgi:hypothetical protein
MTTTQHLKEPYPQPLLERDVVLNELREILASPQFCNSKRYPALLQYVVENTLAGRTDFLKERTIGVEVFSRPPTYDTNADTVVRFTAGEVRKRLAAYYHEGGLTSRVRITLPHGSYVPEFLYGPDETDKTVEATGDSAEALTQMPVFEATRSEPPFALLSHTLPEAERHIGAAPVRSAAGSRRLPGWASAAFVLVALVVLAGWRYWPPHQETAMDAFWHPVLHDRGTILLCAGGNVFAQNPVPGFITAGKETDYPYFSLQTATSITLLSSLIQRNGATPQFDFAASTPLPELHSHPIVLLNAYNNQWTLRLVEPLRFHFSPDSGSDHSILDRMHPQLRWARDLSVPYSDADDYALMARFWDTTTDNWVLVLAGLGRNGTEAASQFVTSPHYMQVLRDQIGPKFLNENIETVLKVSVIDGKTGPPTVVAWHAW